jgi:energy-coupling factor transport system substrate-specific component
MFSAIGTHGPILSPLADTLFDLFFVGFAILLFTNSKPSKMQSFFFLSFVFIIVAGRVILQPLPNVQPVTMAVFLMGAHQGARRGMSFAILVTLLSNLFIGDGWWTLFQAIGWSVVAVLGASATARSSAKIELNVLLPMLVASSILFDLITSLSLIDSSTTLTSFISILYSGLLYDMFHILGNLCFAVWLGESMQDFLMPIENIHEESVPAEDLHVISG